MRNYHKIKLVILLLLIASLPFYLKISNVLIGAGAFLTILQRVMSKDMRTIKVDHLSLAFLAYFFLDVIGLSYTDRENLATGFFTLDKHQSLVLVPIIFSDVKLTHASRDNLLYTFVGSCVIASLICMAVVMHETYILYDRLFHEWLFSHDRLSEPIGIHAVYFALYLCLCVLILLNAIKNNYLRYTKFKIICIVLLVTYILGFITALGARTAIVGILLIIFLNLIIYARQQKSYKVYLLGALIAAIVVAFASLSPVVKIRFMDMLKTTYESSNYGSFFARTHIWLPGIEAIEENLLFGVGTGDHQAELNKKFIKHNYTEGVRLDFNMHSQYLQTALNFGLVGIAVLFSIFFIQIKKGFGHRDYLYLSFILLFMLACITEAMLVVNKGTVFLIVFSFIFYKSNEEAGQFGETSKTEFSTCNITRHG